MLWRHLCLVRAWSAAGLVSGLMIFGTAPAMAQVAAPLDAEAAPLDADAAHLADLVTDQVDLLGASQRGDLIVTATGQGQDRVRLSIRNTSPRRLQVVIPPGLVAASAAGQGGRGLQSMGLGAATNRPGAFGQFQLAGAPGLRSMPLDEDRKTPSLTVPVGEKLELSIPAVCLNFGLPSPTPRDRLTLMDVETYSQDPRMARALRSLAIYGTSQGVAQAVMWHVGNDLPFETMAAEGTKVVNRHELALAARFVEALDLSTDADLVDPRRLADRRIYVSIRGEGGLREEAARLAEQVDGLYLMGLPVRTVGSDQVPEAAPPALLVRVLITDSKVGETRGKVAVSYCSEEDQWQPLGQFKFQEGSSLSVLDSAGLLQGLDQAIAAEFVSVRVARRNRGSTTLRLENRLPFTVAAALIKAGDSAGAPTVRFDEVGAGPARFALLPIQAATGTIARVELNGL